MLSRVATYLAEATRNVFAGGASHAPIARTEESLLGRGPFQARDRVQLGPASRPVSVSRLAIGTGSGGWAGASNQTRKLGTKGMADLFLHGLRQHGINFWDSADDYGSHPHVREALRQVRRDEVVVLTKTMAETPAAMRRDLDRFRRELDTDVIDVLLLHCMTRPDWPRRMRGAMDVISEAQENGVVRVKGVSCHSFSALKAAAGEPWVEVDLARINPGTKEMDASPDDVVPVLDAMRRAGKSVIGMKILGNARLVDRKEACLRFVLGLSCVDCFTVGFESRAELDEVVALIAAVRAAAGEVGLSASGVFRYMPGAPHTA